MNLPAAFIAKSIPPLSIALSKFLLSLYSLIPVTVPLIVATTNFPVAPPIPINPTAVPKPDTAADNQSTSSKLFLSITIWQATEAAIPTAKLAAATIHASPSESERVSGLWSQYANRLRLCKVSGDPCTAKKLSALINLFIIGS